MELTAISQPSYYNVVFKTASQDTPPLIRSIHTNYTSFQDITKIQLSWEDSTGFDVTGWLASFKESTNIRLSVNETDYGIYNISTITQHMVNDDNPFIELEVISVEYTVEEYPIGENLSVSHHNPIADLTTAIKTAEKLVADLKNLKA